MESLSQGKSDPIPANHVNLWQKAKNLLAKHRTLRSKIKIVNAVGQG